jgi:hypothetical protein
MWSPLILFLCLTWCHSDALRVQLGIAQSNSEAEQTAVKVTGKGEPLGTTSIWSTLPLENLIFPPLKGTSKDTFLSPFLLVTVRSLPNLSKAHFALRFLFL